MTVNGAQVVDGDGAVRIQVRRGTAAEMTSANPTLTRGEPAFETDTGFLKVGDGSTAWTSLAYATTKIPGYLTHSGTRVGFYNTTPAVKQEVTGKRSDGTALASLLDALELIGLITDSSTAS